MRDDLPVIVRDRTEADLQACEDLARAVQSTDGYPHPSVGDLRAFLAAPDAIAAWVSEDADQVVGHVALHPTSSPEVMELARLATGEPVSDLRRCARSDRSKRRMRLGIADHLGWAIAVTASADHKVADRRRIELIEPGLPAAPIHYEGKRLDVPATAALVTKVRASVVRATSASLDDLATALPAPIVSISLRAWPPNFPDDISVQRRAPYEARVDAIMYRQVLSELAHARDWEVHIYDAKDVVGQAVSMLGERADEVLQGPRATMGPPWAKDHRTALAATVVGG